MNRDRGSMTIWAAAATALIGLSLGVALTYGTAVVGRHRAGTAADLAALAAAVRVPDGPAAACRAAATVAARNGSAVRTCQVVGSDVEIVVSRAVDLAGVGPRTVVARARAGPVTAPVR